MSLYFALENSIIFEASGGNKKSITYQNTKKRGYSSFGYEPINNPKYNRIYKNKTVIKKQKYDWITLWHVLEHTHNPKKTLKSLISLLNKNGLMAIAIPNINSYDNIYYKNISS